MAKRRTDLATGEVPNKTGSRTATTCRLPAHDAK